MQHPIGNGLQWDPLFSFEIYLRTGRLVRLVSVSQPTEAKFNHWHDPDNGRFTFAGRGRYFGGTGELRFRPGSPDGDNFGGGGSDGSWNLPHSNVPQPSKRTPSPRRAAPSRTITVTVRNPVRSRPNPPHAPAKESWKRILRNGYEYRIDRRGRTRRASGQLMLEPTQSRSRSAQLTAGGPDRRATDDGGHFIARRFNGPTEAFNHFAQNLNFNRGGYRALEDKWAEAIRAGKKVRVKITPLYRGASRRPSSIHIRYWINGQQFEENFPNEAKK